MSSDAHSRTVRDEFNRQARSFRDAPLLSAPELTQRLVEALGGAAEGRVVDVACGPGVLSEALCEKATAMVGLDLTDGALRLARDGAAQRSNAYFVRGLAERPPLAAGSFDGAVLRLALHHVEDPVAVMAGVRPLLRRGGRLVVLDILTSPDPGTAELHNAIERLRDPSHTSLVSQAEIAEQIERAGYRLESETSFAMERDFEGWARIIAQPKRMKSLETLLRHLARAGIGAGIDLRERDGGLWFDYRFGLYVGSVR